MKTKTCCFIGHRTIIETEELKEELRKIIENLIIKENVGTFLFGSKSDFDSLCLEIVTDIKKTYPFIKRVFVRAEYPEINDDYYSYLLKLARVEPFAVSLNVFNYCTLRSFLQGVSLAAKSRFVH